MTTEADSQLARVVLDVASGAEELVPTLQKVVDAARQLTGARFGALGTLGADGLHTAFVHSGISPEVAATMGSLPAGHGLLGEITRRRETVRTENISGHPASVGLPRNHPPMQSFIGVPLTIGDNEVLGNLYLTDSPTGFTEDDERNLRALAALASVAVQNVTLLHEAHRRGRRLEAAAEIAVALLSDDDPEDALELVASNARQVLEADAAVLVLPNMGNKWVMEIAVGCGEATDMVGTVMPSGGRTEQTVASQQGLIIRDLSSDPGRRTAGLQPFGPAVYAPMVTAGEAKGVLIILRLVGGQPFGKGDLHDATTFAHQAAMALELAWARRRREQEALLDQRTELARDLHDFVVQEIFATGAGLGVLTKRAERGEYIDADDLRGVLDRLDGSVSAVRQAISSLRGHSSTPTELLRRIAREMTGARAQLGFSPHLDVSPVVQTLVVDESLADDVAAVLREALSNVARHARAQNAYVSLDVIDGLLMVEVRDDGIGIGTPTRRSGLRTMAERAERNKGLFDAATHAEGGTRLVLRVPIA